MIRNLRGCDSLAEYKGAMPEDERPRTATSEELEVEGECGGLVKSAMVL